MYQTGNTIKETLDEIHRRDLVLPAIQREFVWGREQIYRFFDSLMQGYPFGTFLYWRVTPEISGNFKFFEFVLNYHERDNPHCPPLPDMPNRPLTAVLDGQQRLTALNIGLRGSAAWKLPRLRRTNPDAFPERLLYLDLLWRPGEDDEGLEYRFSFLSDEQSSAVNGECWFPIREVLKMKSGPAMVQWLNQRLPQDHVDQAYETLDRLHRMVHSEHLVAFYEERGQELDKVLQIFIRMNDGGTPLSHSDMLLSVAVAQWSPHDARKEIHELVDELNKIGSGFAFSKDLVLKAGLMLSDIGSVGFKVDNFNRENMDIFESKWDDVKRALTLTVQLVSDFGFTGQNLRAHNAILPIAYYLYMKEPGDGYLTHSQFETDRQAIREWLIRSLLKSGIWGSGLDTLLTALRRVVRENGDVDFPVARIYQEMASRGRWLVFEEGEIEELADMSSGSGLTFALLSLLFPFVNLRNQFHIDHIFPRSRFTERRLSNAGVAVEKIDDFIQSGERLANLQLLEGSKNAEKSAKMPAEWLSEEFPQSSSRLNYQGLHLLGDLPDSIGQFDVFYNARRERLKNRLGKLLGR